MSPMKAAHVCAMPGCPELVTQGAYCAKHKQEQTNRFQRDPKIQRLYDRAWQRKRRIQLAQFPWCQDCEEQGLYVEATDVHHEIRHQGDRKKFIGSPLRSLCHACHSRRTALEVRGRGESKVEERRVSSAGGHPREKNSPISA
jgi:5-methylcytosine-specific restriction protein A